MQENIMKLSDGRNLGYALYGDPHGKPLFLFHGTPGSRLWFLEDDEIAKDLGIRLIAPDRPGYGLSSPKPNRTLLSYAEDINELADFLNISMFSVLGVSGGGAYACAVSHELQSRIEHCLLVSTATPFKDGKPPVSMSKENKLAFFLSRRLPWLIKLITNGQKKLLDRQPEKYKASLRKGAKHLCVSDNELLKKEENLDAFILHAKEAYRQGVEESVCESALLTKKWEFALSNISVPVSIWHGENDTLSPIKEVREMEQFFKHAKTEYLVDKGHFLTDDDEIWRKMLNSL